jgi:hypothetical protein
MRNPSAHFNRRENSASVLRETLPEPDPHRRFHA